MFAGKAAGVPVYKLLGGKVRDRVRVYNGALRTPLKAFTPEEYAEDCRRMNALPQGFTVVKQGISFHSDMKRTIPAFMYGEVTPVHVHGGATDRGLLTERGLRHVIACVEAMKAAWGRRDRAGARLWAGLDSPGRHTFRASRRAPQPDVAGRPDHR